MRFVVAPVLLSLLLNLHGFSQVPESVVADGIPPVAPELRADVGRYLEFRSAGFRSWHPQRREMLVTTRFADTPQLHLVKMPGGARRQLTFQSEPVTRGEFQPRLGEFLVFSRDAGGGEFYQLYRYDLADGRMTLLTDGKARNVGVRWTRSGSQLAYTSTRRTGEDTDIYVIDPRDPKTDRLVVERKGGGWSASDWSDDEKWLLLTETISANESRVHLLNPETREVTLLTPAEEKAVHQGARFARDGQSFFCVSDVGSEFQRLVQIARNGGTRRVLTGHIPWDVEEFELSPDGRTVALISNEEGIGVLRLLDIETGKERPAPRLPAGIPAGIQWHENGHDIGFTLDSARSPGDAYSLDVTNGEVTRWTESETGGLQTEKFAEPELVTFLAPDDLRLSAFMYRPDAEKFPGPRPVIVIIHGGPEGQSRPGFLGRNNYYLNELGCALIFPNVRGSSGYGKTFLTLDNGRNREGSVQDIGALLDWLEKQPGLDAGRVGVMGGSYGGYMTLATMVHYSDRLRCGIDIVGISNFLSFLQNTQGYRRDLRRVEYGDEREPGMQEFLEKISPLNHVDKIRRPLLVVQGKNDPRVPVSEAEQIVKAVREKGRPCWYLMAQDEGHGFGKKKNADFQFLVQVGFLRQFLLSGDAAAAAGRTPDQQLVIQ